MIFSEAAAARDRIEQWIEGGSLTGLALDDLIAVCAWTRHWEHACAELDAMLEADRARARNTKTPTPGADK